MVPAAKSFSLDLLSTLPRGTMPVGALVEGAALFGIGGNAVRVALTRLRAAGLVVRDARGRYRLGAGARPVAQRTTRWRTVEDPLEDWDGSWVATLQARGTHRQARRRELQSLRLLGFRELRSGLWLRPDNLRGGVEALRRELSGLGLEPGTLVFEMRNLDTLSEARARGLWSAEALPDAHQRLRRELEQSEERLRGHTPERAMTESFQLGGRAIRQLVLDPMLPDAIVPGRERRALRDTMRHYDRLGRDAWAVFLARFDVPHRSAPTGAWPGGATERLAR